MKHLIIWPLSFGVWIWFGLAFEIVALNWLGFLAFACYSAYLLQK